MGQYQSLLQNTQVINVKKQAAATDLLDTAVWYYDPDSGRNLWGNRAALELYGISLQAFCSEQKKVWRDALGTAAGDEWQTSNDCLQHELKSTEADQAKPTYITASSRSHIDGDLSDLGVQAGLLPLPHGVLQLSARARPCTVVCNKQQSRTYQVQVTSVQRTSTILSQGSLTSAGKEAARLQITQPLHQQPETIAAGSLQQRSNSSDSILQDIPEGSAQVMTQVMRRQGTFTCTSPTAHQGRRLGATNNSTPAGSTPLRAPTRSLDLSPQAVALILRRGQAPPVGARGSRTASADGFGVADHHALHLPPSRDTGNSLGMFQPVTPEDQLRRQQRLVEMCDKHAMFHFLFDAEGRLLTANRRALTNMREHLGDAEAYTLAQYLAIGQCDGDLSAEEVFEAIRVAIIVNQEPCVRLPQLRWSKRQPGKFRWVLYEVWPLEDPVSKQPVLLVTEQNITQVKAVEEEYSNQMRQLETQLEEAILQQQQAEAVAAEATAAAAAAAEAANNSKAARQPPPFDSSSAAEKTLQLLDKLLNGEYVSADDAEALRSAIVEGGSSLHAPVFLDEQVLQHTGMYAPEVGASLLQMLSTRAPWDVGKDPLPDIAELDGTGSDTTLKSPRSTTYTSGGGSTSPGYHCSDPRLAQVISREPAAFSPSVQQYLPAASAPLPAISAPLPASFVPAPAVDQAAAPFSSDQPRGKSINLTSATAYPTLLQSDLCPRRPSNISPVAVNGGNFAPGAPFSRGAVAAAARDVISLVSAPSTEVDSILAQVDNWQFDSFALSAATAGRPLSTLGFFLLKRSGLVKKLSLDENRLARWLVRVEDGYRANPYHNKIHAADVLRTSHVLLTRGGCGGVQAPDDLTHLAVYLAAMVHDYEHRGVTNDFLVRIGDALALLYNDRSPHENHHLAASWALLAEYNFLRGQPVASKEQLRRMVIDMVLATDMKQHFSVHGLFQSKIHLLMAAGHLPSRRSGSATPATGAPSSAGLDPLSRATSAGATTAVAVGQSRTPTLSPTNSRQQVLSPGPTVASEAPTAMQIASRSGDTDTSNAAVAAGGTSGSGAATLPSPAAGNSFSFKRPRRTSSIIRRSGAAGEPAVWEEDAETKSLYIQMCLKAADLGHLSAARSVHRKWVEALEEENFRQGDREKAAGLNVSPLMDRTRAGITKSQVGFFDIVALPLFRSIAQRFSNATPILEGVLDNYHMWKETEEPANVATQ